MKRCRLCGEDKKADEFYSGLAQCKPCYKQKVRDYREKNIDKVQEYDRKRGALPHRVKARKEYAKTDNGKIRLNEGGKAWKRRNPIKRMANIIVGNAVRDGKLLKPKNCESCDSAPNRLHGHHDDYAFPLVVRWLCPGCHSKWHKENGPGENSF